MESIGLMKKQKHSDGYKPIQIKESAFRYSLRISLNQKLTIGVKNDYI